MKSPAKEIKSVNRTKMQSHNLLFSILISGLIHCFLDYFFHFILFATFELNKMYIYLIVISSVILVVVKSVEYMFDS